MGRFTALQNLQSKGLMEATSEELRTLSNGKSSVKFTTVYPALVLTGIVKKPKIRFPWLMGGILPRKAASLIIDAQRRNYRNKSIPSYWLPIGQILRHFPDKAFQCIHDFIGMSAYEED